MAEESNIKQATPKQGLETGGLVSGSEAARERIAKEYEKDLSGKNGPLARFEALQEIVGRQLDEFSNNLTFSCVGGTQIFGTNGTFSVRGARRTQNDGGVFESPVVRTRNRWDLVPVPEGEGQPGQYKVYRPLIVRSRTDVEGMVGVTNIPFTPEPDKFLVLEITTIPVEAATVALDSGWDGYPSAYKFGDADPWSFEMAKIPIWRFFSEDDPNVGRIRFGEDVFGEKLVPDGPLQVVYTIAQVPSANRVRTVPDLV